MSEQKGLSMAAGPHGPPSSPNASAVVEVRNLGEMSAVINQILDAMARAGFSERDQFGARLSLEEAIVNGIKHGNRDDPRKSVRVDYSVSGEHFTVSVEDEGPGFDPIGVPDPLAPENLERPGGRGVFLMRHYMTSVEYNERGNCVTLCKTRGG